MNFDLETTEPITTAMIDHFRDLFDVNSMDGVYPKMNELYVYVQETRHGLRLLSELLALGENVSTAKILDAIAQHLRDDKEKQQDAIPIQEHTIMV